MRLDEITGTLGQTYFSTYSAAVKHARLQVEKRGYEITEDAWYNEITIGQGKPSDGNTTRHTIPLEKDGKETKHMLAIQVYNRGTDTNPFELNFYIT